MITSINNPTVKQLIKLRKKRNRDQLLKFLVDDIKALENAYQSDYEVEQIFYCLDDHDILSVKKFQAPLTRVSEAVFAKISYGERDKGIVALLKTKEKICFDEIIISEKAVFLVLENIEKPGNLGAILRTADAFRVDAVILTGNSCDFYNHNVIRASRGTCFAKPLFYLSNDEVYALLAEKRFKFYSLDPAAEKNFREIDNTGRRALVFGSEHAGLTQFWKSRGEQLKIPMQGVGDSLNLSVAVALVTAEAKRI